MSRKYKFRDQDKPYFVSFAIINWIDVFTRRMYKDILVESINYCIKNKGLIVYSWCIMSNHVHLIIASNEEKLENIMRDLKRYTSKSILKAIEDNIQESRKEWMLWMFEKPPTWRKFSDSITCTFKNNLTLALSLYTSL